MQFPAVLLLYMSLLTLQALWWNLEWLTRLVKMKFADLPKSSKKDRICRDLPRKPNGLLAM